MEIQHEATYNLLKEVNAKFDCLLQRLEIVERRISQLEARTAPHMPMPTLPHIWDQFPKTHTTPFPQPMPTLPHIWDTLSLPSMTADWLRVATLSSHSSLSPIPDSITLGALSTDMYEGTVALDNHSAPINTTVKLGR